jgi:hypothetical protein
MTSDSNKSANDVANSPISVPNLPPCLPFHWLTRLESIRYPATGRSVGPMHERSERIQISPPARQCKPGLGSIFSRLLTLSTALGIFPSKYAPKQMKDTVQKLVYLRPPRSGGTDQNKTTNSQHHDVIVNPSVQSPKFIHRHVNHRS